MPWEPTAGQVLLLSRQAAFEWNQSLFAMGHAGIGVD